MRVTHLWRYPVKSFGGESLTTARFDRGGIPFDREYIIIDGEPTRKGKPLTARQVATMLAYRASARDGDVVVTAPDGRTFGMDDDLGVHLRSTVARPLGIERKASDNEPFHDAHDVLVLNAASVRALEQEWGRLLNPVRFRPNIMLDGDDARAYEENQWVGRTFALGEAIFEGAKLDERCVLPTIDPITLARDASLLRLIVEAHAKCFGLYCRVRRAGKVSLGDEWLPSSS